MLETQDMWKFNIWGFPYKAALSDGTGIEITFAGDNVIERSVKNKGWHLAPVQISMAVKSFECTEGYPKRKISGVDGISWLFEDEGKFGGTRPFRSFKLSNDENGVEPGDYGHGFFNKGLYERSGTFSIWKPSGSELWGEFKYRGFLYSPHSMIVAKTFKKSVDNGYALLGKILEAINGNRYHDSPNAFSTRFPGYAKPLKRITSKEAGLLEKAWEGRLVVPESEIPQGPERLPLYISPFTYFNPGNYSFGVVYRKAGR